MRKVKIASPLIKKQGLSFTTIEEGNAYVLSRLDAAAKFKPDIICLGEKNNVAFLRPDNAWDVAEKIPGGELTRQLGERAKKYNCYIIMSISEADGDRLHNTAVLYGRGGELVGKYRKTHMPTSEINDGFLPGDTYPVFETDFGKIGMLICWDQVFPEASRIMADAGAEIIFLPTQGDSIQQFTARAMDNRIYMVASGAYNAMSSRIISPGGEVIATATDENDGVAVAEISLEQDPWFKTMQDARRPHTYGRLLDDLQKDGGSEVCSSGENLIPDSAAWEAWCPRPDMKPIFGTDGLSIQADPSKGNNILGKWECRIDGIKPGQWYDFHADYNAEYVDFHATRIYAVLTWNDKDGNLVAMDHVDTASALPDGGIRLSRSVQAYENTHHLIIGLALRWTNKGKVVWQKPHLSIGNAPPPRKVKIASPVVRKNGLDLNINNIDDGNKYVISRLDAAAKFKPDIICLGEKNNIAFFDYNLADVAEEIPGKLCTMLSQKAREHNCYVIMSLLEVCGGKYYNAAVLYGRDGKLVGKYRKSHLAGGEIESGYTPGDTYPVFETDFGKIGMLVCWDQKFPEAARSLALDGAEIIFLPTQGDSPQQFTARAMDNRVYMIAGGADSNMSSRIISPDGELLAAADDENDCIAIAEIDLNKRYQHLWLSVGPGLGEAKSVYHRERRPDTYRAIAYSALCSG